MRIFPVCVLKLCSVKLKKFIKDIKEKNGSLQFMILNTN